ncbi:MAG: xanthine dehydrogenase family protein molybdopterin-binding subunit, partial [Betaproteobacteria bacterium]|nr:xanthine dehydrogenase family protein molybdopterin-binding subunit [Betaproteobacteria bacterium]
AELVRVQYREAQPELDFQRAKANAHKPENSGAAGKPDLAWGDPVDRGAAGADVRIERTYTTPMEHHNPIEPHATLALWEGERLTVYDSTQYISGVKEVLSKTLGMAEDHVRVVSPFVGGGFGCKGSTWSHVVLAAMAARRTGRPVRLVLARPQMFGPVGGRPLTEQRLLLAARRSGELLAVRHDVMAHTSVMEDFLEPAAAPTRALYAVPSGETTHTVAPMNVGVPTFQRAPGESTGTFALESAMDELAYELGIDPLELRLRNYADAEPSTGKPWSSKKLRECYAHAAERFGWSRRPMAPRSLRDGRWLVGWGMATATYPAHQRPASASAKILPDGSAIVRSGTQDIGTGTYTVMTQIAAEALAMPVERVRFELGDTLMPPAGVSGGSTTVASVAPAVHAACVAAREKKNAAVAAGRSNEVVEAHASTEESEEAKKFATRSFGAVFVEARVDEDLGTIRVPRIVAAYSVGRAMNAKLARSQLMGGIVWGISMALMEESLLDHRTGRIVNANLAEYHVPVNADVGEIDVSLCEEDDRRFNPLGGRGIGEIGITGVPAAIANAVFHATGRRIRDLPIQLDNLL